MSADLTWLRAPAGSERASARTAHPDPRSHLGRARRLSAQLHATVASLLTGTLTQMFGANTPADEAAAALGGSSRERTGR